jgi:hypothetical protein
MNAEMRKHALRRYLVLRVKIIEFLDIGALRQGLKAQQLAVPNPVARTPADFADSLRTVQLSWLALLIDKSRDGMDAIKLWSELFPTRMPEIQVVWNRIEQSWNLIRAFRDKAGFHADKPPAFFKARHEVLASHVATAIEEFQNLLRIILHAEATELPDLEQAVDDFLDEMEVQLHSRYDRAEFKRYLMLPNIRTQVSSPPHDSGERSGLQAKE